MSNTNNITIRLNKRQANFMAQFEQEFGRTTTVTRKALLDIQTKWQGKTGTLSGTRFGGCLADEFRELHCAASRLLPPLGGIRCFRGSEWGAVPCHPLGGCCDCLM